MFQDFNKTWNKIFYMKCKHKGNFSYQEMSEETRVDAKPKRILSDITLRYTAQCNFMLGLNEAVISYIAS